MAAECRVMFNHRLVSINIRSPVKPADVAAKVEVLLRITAAHWSNQDAGDTGSIDEQKNKMQKEHPWTKELKVAKPEEESGDIMRTTPRVTREWRHQVPIWGPAN